LTRDEVLATTLGERSGYVRGRGYGAKPPRQRAITQVDVDARVTSALESVQEEMQANMELKLQEERTEMEKKMQEEREEMERKMQEERKETERKMQEERAEMQRKVQEDQFEMERRMQAEVDQKISEQLASLMVRMQQVSIMF